MTETPDRAVLRDRPPAHAQDTLAAQDKALRRAGAPGGAGDAPAAAVDRRHDSWAHIDARLNEAALGAQPRMHWPPVLERFPFKQLPILKRVVLKVMRFSSHDSRRATNELLQGVRLLMSHSIHLEEQLFTAIHDQRRWQVRAQGAEERLAALQEDLAEQSRLRAELGVSLDELTAALGEQAERQSARTAEVAADLAAYDARARAEAAEAAERSVAVVNRTAAETIARLDELAMAMERRVAMQLARATPAAVAPAGNADRVGTSPPGDSDDIDVTVTPGFYARFEAAFRGSQELIRKRQEYYLPRFLEQPGRLAGLPVADLGCGRGEFLDILREQGIATLGVDLNADFLAMVEEKGHRIYNDDAIAWTERQEAGSLRAVTAFHVIEHIPIGHLVRLLAASYRALAPGGLLIFETPNPENVIVGSCAFWIDPTHKRPVVPDLLGLLAREVGFAAPQLVRLNEYRLENPLQAVPADHPLAANLNPLIEAVGRTHFAGPDYALVAVR